MYCLAALATAYSDCSPAPVLPSCVTLTMPHADYLCSIRHRHHVSVCHALIGRVAVCLRSLISKRCACAAQVNDTVMFDIETGKIKDFIKFDVGQLVMITGGHNQGRVGTIVSRQRHKGSFDIILVKDSVGHEFATRCVPPAGSLR